MVPYLEESLHSDCLTVLFFKRQALEMARLNGNAVPLQMSLMLCSTTKAGLIFAHSPLKIEE